MVGKGGEIPGNDGGALGPDEDMGMDPGMDGDSEMLIERAGSATGAAAGSATGGAAVSVGGSETGEASKEEEARRKRAERKRDRMLPRRRSTSLKSR